MRNRLSAITLVVVPAMLAVASPATRCIAQASSRLTAPDSSWVSHSAIYEVFVRDFSRTGDFRGVTRGLDRIQAVGANVLWLMPIYPVGIANRKGTLGSPYAVRDYLASRGINVTQLAVAGHGESQPVADNTTVEGRQQNRRVVMSRTNCVVGPQGQ